MEASTRCSVLSLLAPIVLSATYADWLLSRHLPASDVFHGWTGLSLAGLRTARRQGAVTIVENRSMHPGDWQKIVLAECEAFGIRPSECRAVLPSRLMRRMLEEYKAMRLHRRAVCSCKEQL